MDREGIEVRPIASMLGPHHLNEVFLDNVRVGPDDVLGEVGAGWAVMRDALAYERVGIARYARCESLLARLRDALDDQWDELPPAVQTRWVRALVSLRVARLLAYRAVANHGDGIDPADASAARIVTTMCDQAVAEVLLEAVGATALDAGPRRAARRRDRRPLALRAGRDRVLGHDRGAADDRRARGAGWPAVNTALPADVMAYAESARRRLDRARRA